jgi:glutamate-1-semialdehyde 2,1-aminomutase
MEQSSLLIFDEVITGFKFAGCAQGYYGVIPDLATLGKTLGGGLPIGAVVGEREIMELADGRVWMGGGTFSGNVSTMTTGLATLKYLKEHHLYDKMEEMGAKIREGIDKIFREHDTITTTTGIGPFLLTHFPSDDVPIMSARDANEKADPKKKFEYHLRLIKHGILFLPGHGGMVSAVHSDKDIDKILEATGEVAKEMAHGD